jgi:DNA-binding GntR family transcriptional regulator
MTSPLAHPLELLRSLTLSGLVQDEILRRIKAGEIAAGARLNELELSQHLGVSRAPVREALRALGEAGLVRLEKNRGVFLRELTEQEVTELYEVRATLDEMAGRLLAPIIGEAQILELKQLLAVLESASVRDGVNGYFPLNISFHDRLVEMTGNATLLELYRQVVNRMHLVRRQSFATAGSSAASHAEHRQILEALQTGDAEAAGAAMRAHVDGGYARNIIARRHDAADPDHDPQILPGPAPRRRAGAGSTARKGPTPRKG